MLSFRVLWDSLDILILRGSCVWSRDQELITPSTGTLPQAASQFAPEPSAPQSCRARECMYRSAFCSRVWIQSCSRPFKANSYIIWLSRRWDRLCTDFCFDLERSLPRVPSHAQADLLSCPELEPICWGILPIADEVCQHHTIPNPADKSYSLIGFESALGCLSWIICTHVMVLHFRPCLISKWNIHSFP